MTHVHVLLFGLVNTSLSAFCYMFDRCKEIHGTYGRNICWFFTIWHFQKCHTHSNLPVPGLLLTTSAITALMKGEGAPLKWVGFFYHLWTSINVFNIITSVTNYYTERASTLIHDYPTECLSITFREAAAWDLSKSPWHHICISHKPTWRIVQPRSYKVVKAKDF